MILGAVAVFAAVSFGSAYSHLTGLKAPDSIMVDGQPMSLQQGRVFLFFYDPECGTCFAVGKSMAPLKFKATTSRWSASPPSGPQEAASWIRDSGLHIKTSTDAAKLRDIFKFDNPPYAALIERGRQTGVILPTQFDEDNPSKHIALLKQMGVLESSSVHSQFSRNSRSSRRHGRYGNRPQGDRESWINWSRRAPVSSPRSDTF